MSKYKKQLWLTGRVQHHIKVLPDEYDSRNNCSHDVQPLYILYVVFLTYGQWTVKPFTVPEMIFKGHLRSQVTSSFS